MPEGDPTNKLEIKSAIAVTDRRTAARYKILQQCFIRPAAGSGCESWKGIAYDVSAVGIGVALPYPLSPGTVVIVEPAGPGPGKVVHACVVRSAPVAHLWFCGCELACPLNDEELSIWTTRIVDSSAATESLSPPDL